MTWCLIGEEQLSGVFTPNTFWSIHRTCEKQNKKMQIAVVGSCGWKSLQKRKGQKRKVKEI